MPLVEACAATKYNIVHQLLCQVSARRLVLRHQNVVVKAIVTNAVDAHVWRLQQVGRGQQQRNLSS